MSVVHIGFTGTRDGMNRVQLKKVIEIVDSVIVDHIKVAAHHGDCLGADVQFHGICLAYQISLFIHPCDKLGWVAGCDGPLVATRHPMKPPLDRNRDIVDESVLLIAAPNSMEEKRRSGTWSTWRYACSDKRTITCMRYEVHLVLPDGSVRTTHVHHKNALTHLER
jgi:hypothetical protein